MIDKQMLSLVKESVRKLYDAKKERDKIEEYYNSVRNKEQIAISNFMFTNLPKEENSFTVELDEGANYYTNHTKLLVTRVRNKKVIWNIKKLKQKLGKTIYNKIVDKTYTVNDMAGLIEYLKSCGVDPKKFKKFIDVKEEVDEKKLNAYFDRGEIKNSVISGCYEVRMSEPYIRLTEQGK